jgi:hypothetical protein
VLYTVKPLFDLDEVRDRPSLTAAERASHYILTPAQRVKEIVEKANEGCALSTFSAQALQQASELLRRPSEPAGWRPKPRMPCSQCRQQTRPP